MASLSPLECTPHFKITKNIGGLSEPSGVCAPQPVELKHLRGKRSGGPGTAVGREIGVDQGAKGQAETNMDNHN